MMVGSAILPVVLDFVLECWMGCLMVGVYSVLHIGLGAMTEWKDIVKTVVESYTLRLKSLA